MTLLTVLENILWKNGIKNFNNIIIPFIKIGKVFAVDLTSLVVVGITIVLMGLTRKTKKNL